jgi:phospholipase C
MIGRREFLRGTLGGAAWLAGPRPARARLRLPPPGGSGVEHIVVVTMENRSFDHVLGWHPTADGRQAGLDYADAGGVRHATYPLAPDYAGCGHPDPDHSWDGGRVQYAGGAMDGFLRSGASDVLAIGYYGEADRPFASALARH